jgi:hypothetical protein
MKTVRSNEIYEQEEATRKILISQVNMLKHCKSIWNAYLTTELKMEMENR